MKSNFSESIYGEFIFKLFEYYCKDYLRNDYTYHRDIFTLLKYIMPISFNSI